MNLSKACRLALLASFSCLLLTGAMYADTVVWNVSGNPTEVIYTGRSEVSGSITLTVVNPEISNGGFVVTGNPNHGPSQLQISYAQNSYMAFNVQIDNYTDTGIRVYGPAFASQGFPLQLIVQNTLQYGVCSGQIQILVPPNINLKYGDIIKVEGVRLRVDLLGVLANTDLWVQLQSVDNTNIFNPDTVRVAKTQPGMYVGTTSDTGMLCFLNWGSPSGTSSFLTQYITITEGFYRAFVAKDANNDGVALSNDRLDAGGPNYPVSGAPSWLGGGGGNGAVNINGTMVKLYLSGIPNSVVSVSWPATVWTTSTPIGSVAWFQEIPTSETFVTGTAGGANNGYASAFYEYFTKDQTGQSDISLENFRFSPALKLSATNQVDTGTVLAGATLWPAAETLSATCPAVNTNADGTAANQFYGHPFSGYAGYNGSGQPIFDANHRGKPRFLTLWQSSSGVTGVIDANNQLPSNFGVYEVIISCRCFMLFPYVVSTPFYNTGIAVANTSQDSQVFGSAGASQETGTVAFWLYDRLNKNLNTTAIYVPASLQAGYATDIAGNPLYAPGQSLITLLTQILAQLPTPPAQFQGYMIARANFQYCHGFAFVADIGFANISQGYLAPIIPDPKVKTTYRTASAAADVVTKLLAGESLNN